MKLLLVTVCNDNYITGMLVFLFSLLKHNNLECDLKIYYKDNLSLENQNKIKKLYKNIMFENVQDPDLKTMYPAFLSLLCFKEIEYDRVVFLDCDILCIGSITKLLNFKNNFCVCLDQNSLFPTKKKFNIFFGGFKPITEINTGVFVINKFHLNLETFEKLKTIAKKNIRLKREKLWDQTVLNKFFRFKNITIIPSIYNCRKQMLKNKNPKNHNIKLIHYCGTYKPFIFNNSGYVNAPTKYKTTYNSIYKLWDEYYEEYKSSI